MIWKLAKITVPKMGEIAQGPVSKSEPRSGPVSQAISGQLPRELRVPSICLVSQKDMDPIYDGS